ncbi:MAG: hypothetical protein JJ896_17820 [Rhodothermales bacterium]|nr:hypothetical protein [Rhodothermales bacterium]
MTDPLPPAVTPPARTGRRSQALENELAELESLADARTAQDRENRGPRDKQSSSIQEMDRPGHK